MTKQLLAVENLDINFKLHEETVHAVHDISFKVAEGETLALVSESDSDESVTSMSIIRLLPEKFARYDKDSRIMFDGISILDADEKTLYDLRGNRISVVFQEPMASLDPFMRIGTQLTEAAHVYNKELGKKETGQRTLVLLQRISIKGTERHMKQYPRKFSGGQLQRVMTAMALINEPDLLITDEPTTTLDVTIQAEILDLLHGLQQQMGMAIILITHDLGLVEHYSKIVCVMRNGEIVERGEIEEVFAHPKHKYTVELTNAIPRGMKESEENNAGVLISADNVHVSLVLKQNFFGKPLKAFDAVKGISLKIREGKTLGVVDRSGSDKSTLGKTVIQILPHTNNTSFEGKDLKSYTVEGTRRLKSQRQAIFQDPFGSLSPRLTASEIIGKGLTIHHPEMNKKERIQCVLEVMKKVSLPLDALSRYPHEFSGGQCQRIATARAVILRPKFILLGEPTFAPDRSAQSKVVELLRDLQKKYGLTYMFISHDLSIVHAVSGNVIMMKQGEVVEHGSANQIFHHPQNSYAKRLINAAFDL